MESETEQSPKTKMESLRTICDREVLIQQQKIDSFTASFPTSLHSIKALALDTAQNHAKLAKLKAKLREAEDGLVKVLAAKTRKEAKQMATRDSISAIKARVEELKRTVQVQRARRDEYGAIISQQSLALSKTEEEAKHETEENGEIQEAISWYNWVLGFQIEGGHGVKFTFNNINIKNPKQEYSFTIRLANDAYSLLECDPQLNGIQELINELNRTNGLFKFVRIMREKFQEAAALGLQPQFTSFYQDYSTISMSGPALSVSTDRSESSAKKNEHHIPLGELNRQFKKVNHGSNSPGNINENQVHDGEINIHPNKVAKSDILSPFVRRSPRLKGHTFQK
ncbi:probable kinetochore protein SPC25 isoform X2 [Durio zibethinus]|uniref:Kinetochore protein SPC25 n=1 Tax=Durio zibethinus TaxID=66656 RepID=A0A6P5YCP4_DURZI|nr:probable kinetochore protein SPC25 isoform X2 [Durio zibethinus]